MCPVSDHFGAQKTQDAEQPWEHLLMVSGVLTQNLIAIGLEIHVQMAHNLTNIFVSMYSLCVQNFRENE